MKVATLLFTCNRYKHTKQVLDALSKNSILPQKLYVFQDGFREGTDKEEWNKVNCLIQEIDWCDKEVMVSEYNKGLADSIVSGINYAFVEYDAVIVLEDDCVPMPGFMRFMNQCFETYEGEKNIYSVSGYAWPINLKSTAYDAYYCGRISSWGWGTWKDRWEKYAQDYEVIRRLKRSEAGSRQLALWGCDLPGMLGGRVKGENDSWAVFWALNVIENQGLCINPYISLINNIGCDGSGIHCGVSEKFEVLLDESEGREYRLPTDYVEIQENERAFTELWGCYSALKNAPSENKEKILVYGVGNFFFSHERKINEQYEIVAFIDQHKWGYYAGKKILKAGQISGYQYDRIYIAVKSLQESLKISEMLCERYAISSDRILIGTQDYMEGR